MWAVIGLMLRPRSKLYGAVLGCQLPAIYWRGTACAGLSCGRGLAGGWAPAPQHSRSGGWRAYCHAVPPTSCRAELRPAVRSSGRGRAAGRAGGGTPSRRCAAAAGAGSWRVISTWWRAGPGGQAAGWVGGARARGESGASGQGISRVDTRPRSQPGVPQSAQLESKDVDRTPSRMGLASGTASRTVRVRKPWGFRTPPSQPIVCRTAQATWTPT